MRADDEKHDYEWFTPVDIRPWWRKPFAPPPSRFQRCSICLLSIDAIIADLEEQEAAIKNRLNEARANKPRQRACLDYEFDGYNEIGAMG